MEQSGGRRVERTTHYDTVTRRVRHKPRGAWWLALLLVPVLIAAIALIARTDHIENKLKADSGAALAAAGVRGADISFSGRDATIKVPAGVGADQAKSVVEGVDGVRVASVSTSGAIAATPNVTPPPTTSTAAGGDCATLNAQITALLAKSKITFDTGSAKLTPASRTVVGDVAGLAKPCAGVKLAVNGHTDGTGGNGASLSQARANAVKAQLVTSGLDAGTITATGHGSSQPIASNKTPAGRAANRRVEITVQ